MSILKKKMKKNKKMSEYELKKIEQEIKLLKEEAKECLKNKDILGFQAIGNKLHSLKKKLNNEMKKKE